MNKFIQLATLILLTLFSINVAATTTTEPATLCQKLQEKLQTLSNSIADISQTDLRIYTAFSQVLMIEELYDESDKIQATLQSNLESVQKNQIELQNIYSLMCTSPDHN